MSLLCLGGPSPAMIQNATKFKLDPNNKMTGLLKSEISDSDP